MIRLKREREKRGWSRAELARRSQVNESNYGAIENRRRIPYPPEIARICAAISWEGAPEELLEEVSSDA